MTGQVIGSALAAWVAAIMSAGFYLGWLHNGRPNVGGDWLAASTAAGIAFAIMVPTLYLPAMALVNRSRSRDRWWAYSIAGMVIAPLSLGAMAAVWGGTPDPLAPEALLVFTMCVPAGLAIGVVYR